MLKNVKFARVQLLQKGIIGKRMLKVKAAQKGRPKNGAKDSTWRFQAFLIFFLLK